MLQVMPKGPLQAVLMTAQPLKEAMHKMQQMVVRHRYA